jgi:diguanylate cyclase (GGDEF)-like protein/PAS domain S-box-containing protein
VRSTGTDRLPVAEQANAEVASLIATLHQTEQRLEALTAGEVDTVSDRDGRTILLRRAQDHLRHQEAAKQAAILNALPAQIALLDSHGRILSVNEAWTRFSQANTVCGLGSGVGTNFIEICDLTTGEDGSDAHQLADGIRSVLGGRVTSYSIEYPRHSLPELHCYLSTVTPLTDDPASGAIVMRRDVTAERRATDSLLASELQFRQLAENIREVFWLTDAAKTCQLYVSPAYEEIWGRSCQSLYASPHDWIDAIHPEDRERVWRADQAGQAGDERVEEYRIIRPDGTIRWIRNRAFPIFRKGEVYRIAGLAEDITERRESERLAYYDGLTGLANRLLFIDRVAQHLRAAASAGHKSALFVIDLERFKNINDSLGRPTGDLLLRQVAQWLTRNAGDASLVARIDADHFALVLPKVAYEGDVVRLIEKSMTAFLNHPFELNDTVYRIAAKVGVALFPDDGTDADTLFRNAEAAVKKAQVSGDQYLFYASKMTDTVAGSLGLENDLRQAVDKGEFVLHYQPKVNLVSGKLTGAEALIRWNDPRTGLVPPGRFIRILEDTGLIREVGRWALHSALAEHLRWRGAGVTAPRIAVNVSALQLRSRSFVADIEQIIGRDPNAAAGLELEITESLIMEDVRHSVVTLHAIRAMGVTIAIDDFGTGFSSLSYLSKLPVDTLKIDRSFVINMAIGADGVTLVSVIINLAHALNLKVVAEGVETEEQLQQLRLLNCDEMQGYLFGQPVPGEIFESRYLVSR